MADPSKPAKIAAKLMMLLQCKRYTAAAQRFSSRYVTPDTHPTLESLLSRALELLG